MGAQQKLWILETRNLEDMLILFKKAKKYVIMLYEKSYSLRIPRTYKDETYISII